MVYPIPAAPVGVDADEWAAAISSIRGYCGWHIAPEVEETVTVDGPGRGDLVLPTLRLVDLVTLTSDGTVTTDPEWSSSGIVSGGWSSKRRGVVVTMLHGFEEWPAELTAAAKDMVAEAGRGGASSVTSGAHSVSYEGQAERHADALERYRLGPLP